MNWNRILLIISMFLISVFCFAQKKADKLFLEGQELQKVMTIESQEKAIKKFKSAKAIYRSDERRGMCDNQIEVCNNNIKRIKEKERKPDNPQPTTNHRRTIPDSTPQPVLREVTNMQYKGGTYSGSLKNGKPHGKGKFVFGTKAIISEYDLDKAKAEAGESVEGNFENGVFYRGIYHSVSGDKKLNFGSKGE